MKKNIINIFNYLSIKVFNQGFTNINSKTLDLFISSYKDVLTNDFIWNYISFQMAYWYKLKTKHKIALSWFFGEKAVERWERRPESFLYYNQLFLNELGIEKPISYYRTDLRSKFEEVRSKDFNTDKGLENCLSEAFYSKSSNYCKICDFKDICKQL